VIYFFFARQSSTNRKLVHLVRTKIEKKIKYRKMFNEKEGLIKSSFAIYGILFELFSSKQGKRHFKSFFSSYLSFQKYFPNSANTSNNLDGSCSFLKWLLESLTIFLRQFHSSPEIQTKIKQGCSPFDSETLKLELLKHLTYNIH